MKHKEVLTLILASFWQTTRILLQQLYEHDNNGQLLRFNIFKIGSVSLKQIMPTIYTYLKQKVVLSLLPISYNIN